ncbi:hypothetical protein B5F07_11370 [Lachnoclostridium sp. An169]|uniref:right-handed parallel beta-helix repeat-containing protein n=1 Tax=Lachnoclostridium sp. An169 TaxID=1965569 RepID=UPI000B3924F7|nr:right-handed parallel beta-helix repeat-containing protein [Lachnoclostridium sp. An169]OUP83271.1 hypothetical protein B5F07_11370 [Lachnoclostridium sp. An169]
MRKGRRVIAVTGAAALILGMPVYAADGNTAARELDYYASLTVAGVPIVSYGGVTGNAPDGVSYDLQTNTLTLKDYKVTSEDTVLNSSGMGDDFKIRLEGANVLTVDNGKNNTVTAVSVDSASIGGSGSLTIDMSETAGGDGIMYDDFMTIRDCELNITGDFAYSPFFYGITKDANTGAGNLTVENAEVNIHSAIADDARIAGTNVGIDAQNGNMTVKNSDINVEVVNGEIFGIGVGLRRSGIEGGSLSVEDSTVTCVTKSSYEDDHFPYNIYFYEMENPAQNYYYVGDEAPDRQADFDEAFETEWFMDDRYRGVYDCLIISADPIADYCDHQWDEGTVTEKPSCETQGEITYTCTVCGDTKTEAVDALGHDWGEWTQIKKPTCTEAGVQMRTCGRCGETENADVDALGHDYVEKVTKEATCTEDGVREVTCSRCNYSREETIPATGHSYGEWVVEKEATFHEDGLKTSTCENCGDVRSERIPKLSESHVHDFSGAEEIITPATCTETGSMKVYCKEPECGEYTVKEIPMTEHAPGEWTAVKEATCTEEGLEQRTCTVCGTVTDSRITEKVPHTYGEWTVVTPATCTEAGVESAECTVCGETTVRGINALGHDFADWEVKVPATCTEDGEETSVCTRCGETTTRVIEASGHSYGEWVVTKEPTETEEGQREAVCSVCGDVIVEKVPAVSDAQPVPPTDMNISAGNGNTPGAGSGSNSDVPKTGDTAPVVACAAVVIAAAAGVIFAVRKRSGFR